MQTNFIVDKKQLEISLKSVDAISLNGKKLSELMTKAEYENINVKDPDTIYLIEDDSTNTIIPDYSTPDANKILAVNASGTALAWINAPTGEGGSGLTVEQINQLQAAYQHSQSPHVQASDIPNISGLQPKTDNGLATTDKTIVGAINEVKNDLDNGIDAVSLNGKTFSKPMTQAEYNAIVEKDPNVLYLVYEE